MTPASTGPDEALLKIEQEGAVRLLTLNRPQALNAFTTALLVQLRDALEAAARDASALPARVLHVNRAGPIVRVELETLWGDPVRVELGRERLPALPLAPGEHVFLHAEPDSLYVVPDA